MMRAKRAALLVALALAATGCATGRSRVRESLPEAPAVVTPAPIPARPPAPAAPPAPTIVQTGTASWYGRAHHGRKTASGEPYDMSDMTAAHRSLPIGTRVRVTNVANGRSVVVRVNDRGPFVDGRIIDVSHAAARALEALGAGLFRARIEVLEDTAAEPPAAEPPPASR